MQKFFSENKQTKFHEKNKPVAHEYSPIQHYRKFHPLFSDLQYWDNSIEFAHFLYRHAITMLKCSELSVWLNRATSIPGKQVKKINETFQFNAHALPTGEQIFNLQNSITFQPSHNDSSPCTREFTLFLRIVSSV